MLLQREINLINYCNNKMLQQLVQLQCMYIVKVLLLSHLYINYSYGQSVLCMLKSLYIKWMEREMSG